MRRGGPVGTLEDGSGTKLNKSGCGAG